MTKKRTKNKMPKTDFYDELAQGLSDAECLGIGASKSTEDSRFPDKEAKSIFSGRWIRNGLRP